VIGIEVAEVEVVVGIEVGEAIVEVDVAEAVEAVIEAA
jgi:hypothetical protein